MAKGFTLLELLVVLAILGLTLLVVPSFAGAGGRIQLQGTARTLAARAASVRDTAIRERRSIELSLTASLPEGTSVTYMPGMAPLLGEAAHRLVFYPDGSSTGGTVTLTRGDRLQSIRVDWLTGRVTLDE